MTITSYRAACESRFARKLFKSIPNRHMRISSFSCRHERRYQRKKPVSSTARAIIGGIPVRPKALNTKSQVSQAAFAAPVRLVVLSKQTERHRRPETGKMRG